MIRTFVEMIDGTHDPIRAAITDGTVWDPDQDKDQDEDSAEGSGLDLLTITYMPRVMHEFAALNPRQFRGLIETLMKEFS